MKKITLILMALFMFVTVTGCGKENKLENYQYEHVGIYDTEARQNIDIGDNKERIEKILGHGTKDDDSNHYSYSDNLSINYDDNNNAERISITFGLKSKGDLTRYTLSDGTCYTSTVTDFIDKYPYVYIYDTVKSDNQTPNDVVIILQKTDNKYTLKSKEELVSMQEANNLQEDLYKVEVDYLSYDSILRLEVEKVKEYKYSPTDWDEVLINANQE